MKKIDRIIKECISRLKLNEDISQSEMQEMNNLCDKLNELANSVQTANVLDDGFPLRYQNYRVESRDGEYLIAFDILDSDGGKEKDCEYISDFDDNDDIFYDRARAMSFYKEHVKLLNKGIKYAQSHMKLEVPQKEQAKLDALNAEIDNAIQEYGTDYLMMEGDDDSSFIAKNFRFTFEGNRVRLIFDSDNGTEECYTDYGPWFENVLGIWLFNDEDLKASIKYYKKCLKNGIRYFKEYNPDWDDDDDARERFFSRNQED